MTDHGDLGDRATRALEVLVGDWDVTVDLPGRPGVQGRSSFTWLHGRRYLLNVATADVPEMPDVHAVIAPVRDDGGRFLQHYFDSRGVVRLYEMTLDGRTWTMRRTAADFTPLDFDQQFVGEISADGRTIAARWEAADPPGGPFELDFPLVYRRRTAADPHDRG
jgi:hypothetical protein